MSKQGRRRLSPATHFLMILMPFTLNGFFTVYALTGFIIDGRDKFNWSIEAGEVAKWVALLSVGFSALCLLYARWRNGAWQEIPKSLVWSCVLQALWTLLMVALVVIALGMDGG